MLLHQDLHVAANKRCSCIAFSAMAHLLHTLQEFVAFSELIQKLLAATHLEYAWAGLCSLHCLHAQLVTLVKLPHCLHPLSIKDRHFIGGCTRSCAVDAWETRCSPMRSAAPHHQIQDR